MLLSAVIMKSAAMNPVPPYVHFPVAKLLEVMLSKETDERVQSATENYDEIDYHPYKASNIPDTPT